MEALSESLPRSRLDGSGSPLKRKLISTALIALFWFQGMSAFGWGNEGHLYINRVAAEKVPAEMPRFLRHAVGELTYLGPERFCYPPSPNFSCSPLGYSFPPFGHLGTLQHTVGSPRFIQMALHLEF